MKVHLLVMEQIRMRTSNFRWWMSKFRGRRATFDGGEQVQGPRSNFHVQRASLIDMEQIRTRASKFRGRRATFDGGEQVQGPRSNFHVQRASLIDMEQIRTRASKFRGRRRSEERRVVKEERV